ncbi:MAG: glycoside hydrolase family 2 protein [Anaerolineae bacterium]
MMELPRPEYPRPRLTGRPWLNLNGIWEFARDPGRSGIARGLADVDALPDEIQVPFCPESDLSGIGHTDFMPAVWYRRQVRLPDDWQDGRVLLHIGACDHDTRIWVNGQMVGHHRGGYTPVSVEVTRALRRGDNVITILAEDDTRSPLQATGKQCPRFASYGCFYTRTTGIWQTVWLELVPCTYVSDLRVTPDLAAGAMRVEADLGGDVGHGTMSVNALLDGELVAEGSVAYAGTRAGLVLRIPDPQAWGPGHPVLYDLEVTLTTDARSRDVIASYAGMRDVSLGPRSILLNGEPVFQRLVLDQGFYPDGIYTAPSDDALRRDIEISMAAGFNGARFHQKVFEPRSLYWADRLGYLVWDEFPSWGLDLTDATVLAGFVQQWLEVMRRDASHPSVVGWCPNNETKVQDDPETIRTLYRVSKAVDPSRPVIDTSGYVHVETDVFDVHDYEQDPEAFASHYAPMASGGDAYVRVPESSAPYVGQPYFVSEYGGIWWNPGQDDKAAWGYGGIEGRPESVEAYLARYRALTVTLLQNPAICAFCYTQLTDVEQEVNGVYTYDRREKFDPARLREINSLKAAIES